MKKVVTIATEYESNGVTRVLLPGSVWTLGPVPVTLSFNHENVIGVATDLTRDDYDVKMLIEIWDDHLAEELFNEDYWAPTCCVKMIEVKKHPDPLVSLGSDVSKAELKEVAFVSTNPALQMETVV